MISLLGAVKSNAGASRPNEALKTEIEDGKKVSDSQTT